MQVSIKDIAKAAGVSHSTVSRALSDSFLVEDETKARIQRLAQEMGSSPDAIARRLVMQRTHSAGMLRSQAAILNMRQEADGLSAFARKADKIRRDQPISGSVAPIFSGKASILRIAGSQER